MLKRYILSIFILILMFLSGCSVPSTLIEDNQTHNEATYINTEYFSLEIPSDFKSTSSDFLYENEEEILLNINSIYSLAPYTPDESYDEFKNRYLYVDEVIYLKEDLTQFTSIDGTVYYNAYCESITEYGAYLKTEFLFIPEHNLIVILAMETKEESDLSLDFLDKMKESISFRTLNNHSLVDCSLVDNYGGMLILSSDNTFKYHSSLNDTSSYVFGTYKYAFSNDAVNLLTTLPSLENEADAFNREINTQLINYTVMYDDSILENDYIVSLSDFFSLVLYVEGESNNDNLEEYTNLIPYYGFYVPSLDSFDLVNLNTGGDVLFTKK